MLVHYLEVISIMSFIYIIYITFVTWDFSSGFQKAPLPSPFPEGVDIDN